MPHPPVPQLGHYGGLSDEVDSLKRDKNLLMLELVRLRQAQQVWGRAGAAAGSRAHARRHPAISQPACARAAACESAAVLLVHGKLCARRRALGVSARTHIHTHTAAHARRPTHPLTPPTPLPQANDARVRDLQQRLDSTESRQQTIINFLGRVAHNPAVLQQLVAAASQHGGGGGGVPRLTDSPAKLADGAARKKRRARRSSAGPGAARAGVGVGGGEGESSDEGMRARSPQGEVIECFPGAAAAAPNGERAAAPRGGRSRACARA